MTKAKTKAKAKRMPGKERPAASRLVIQRPRPRSFTIGISPETQNPLSGQPIRPTAEGLALPIPSEPTPRHRPWVTPQGATPAERLPP